MLPDLPHAPLILTLSLDADAQAWFDALRQRSFPPGRLHVGAHVTLFHALPGAREAEVGCLVAELCAAMAPCPVHIEKLRFLGRGVAFALLVPGVAPLRARLAATFAPDLTAQDRARWSPHVTIQNKVSPAAARRTEAELAALAWPSSMTAQGIAIWRYRGGPWQPAAAHRFSATTGRDVSGPS